MTPLLASALLLLAPTAEASPGFVFKDVCDSTVRSSADEVACICAKKAAAAESAVAGTTIDPDYTDWWSGFSYAGGTKSVNGTASGSTASARANDSCFDLIDHVNASSAAVREGYLEALEGYAITGAALGGYSYGISTSDADGDGYQDWVDSFGTFGAEATVMVPAPRFPPIGFGELDPWNTEMHSEQGPEGTVDTGGRDIAGGFLQDVNGNGELDAVIFLEDGGNFVLEDVAPHKMYTLPPQ